MGAKDVVEPTFISLPKPLKTVLVAHFGGTRKMGREFEMDEYRVVYGPGVICA